MSDDLHEFDLDAWEAPRPPAGLADAVIARARAGVPAVETEAPRARRWWLAAVAGVLVAGAAAGALFALGGKHAGPAQGSVDAERAQRLDLDSVSAELDTGAGVSWHRESDALAVSQPRGNASWRVGDDHLRIDAGSGVQIDATGASLRVEVHMLNTDARVLGASTLTAAAVAFVTVVVYEGHVKVQSAGQTVNVEPGATVQVQPGQPPGPPPPLLVAADDQRVIELQSKVEELQAQLDKMKPAGTAPPPLGTCDEVACVLDNYANPCCAKYVKGPHAPATGTALDRVQISEGVGKMRAQIMSCGDLYPAKGMVKLHVRVARDGTVAEVKATDAPNDKLGECVAGKMSGAKFPKTDTGGSFSYPFVFDVAIAPQGCDASELDKEARDNELLGQHGAALAQTEKAIACQPNLHRYQVAFMEACNSGNAGKAKQYWDKIPNHDVLLQMCVRNGISRDTLDADNGYLVLASRPPAKIEVDGRDTGLITPVTGQQLPLTPGRHKVTFLVGADRYTYVVNVRSGETQTMSKDLQ